MGRMLRIVNVNVTYRPSAQIYPPSMTARNRTSTAGLSLGSSPGQQRSVNGSLRATPMCVHGRAAHFDESHERDAVDARKRNHGYLS